MRTQLGFSQKVQDLRLQYYLSRADIKKFKFPLSPVALPQIEYEIELITHFKKNETNEFIMRENAIKIIELRYPEEAWLHIYTDSSLMEKYGNVGRPIGIYSKLFSFRQTLGPYYTNFEGEIEAIRIALTQLKNFVNHFQKAVIFCDSRAAIEAIAKLHDPKTNRVKNVQDEINSLQQNNKSITIQWIPSHCGLNGNERADLLAKKGTTIMQIRKYKISYLGIKRIINYKFKEEYCRKLTKSHVKEKSGEA